MDRLMAMRQFVTVVDAGSFSAASKLLNIGQPAVSKAVAALEDYLGVRLLIRTTSNHSLTDAGQRYYERARIALDEADAAEAAARDEDSALTGRLRIAAPPVYASQQIIPRLNGFLSDHPDLFVDLVLDDRRIDLVEEGIDLAIRAGDLEDSNMVAKRIDTAQRMIVGAPIYLDRAGTPQAPGELAQHRVVTYTRFEGAAAWQFKRGSSSVSVTVDGPLRVSSAEGLRAAVMAGLGLGMVSDRMFDKELADGRLRAILRDWALPVVDLWAVFPAGRRPTARARLFAEWLAEVMRPH